MKIYLGIAAALLAIDAAAEQAVEFHPLTELCEESLALSALPLELRDRANVYVWRNGGFEQSISSGGGFHCLVQRNHPDSIIPECVTSTGEHSILQGIIAQTKMTANGLSAEEVAAQSARMIEDGKIGVPTEPGVNYMMSAYNRIYTSNSDSIANIGPHTMFFAPHASNEVIGGSFAMAWNTKGFPFVADAGAHSYIVTFTERSSATDDVEKNCEGQIDLASEFVTAD